MDNQQQADKHRARLSSSHQAIRNRYLVTLNAPTTAVKRLGDPPISYVDQDVVYHLSILDTTPSCDEAHQYHTVVRLCLDGELEHTSSQLHCASKEPVNERFCTIEYAPYSQDKCNPQTLPVLHSSLERSFSVTWSSSAVTGGAYCLVPIKFRNMSCPRDVTMKLFAGTERICVIDTNISCAEQFQESIAHVRLFSGGNVQAIRRLEVVEVEQKIAELEFTLRQDKIQVDGVELGVSMVDNALASRKSTKKRNTKKRKVSMDVKPSVPKTQELSALIYKLATARKELASVRPVQIFRPVAAVQGEQTPFHMQSPAATHVKATTSGISAHRRPIFSTSRTEPKVSFKKAATAGSREVSPVVCLYVRPEHLPSASYTAIYLAKQDLPTLLAGVSSKFRIPYSAIGPIYYYDQHMASVFVNEQSIESLSHEQDLIVRVLFSGTYSPADRQVAGTENVHGYSTYHKLDSFTGIKSEQTMQNSQYNMFDQYLTLQPENSYSGSVDSWSELTDDASLSISQMYNQCSSAKTTMSSDDGIFSEEGRFQHQLGLDAQGVDHAGYNFDVAVADISTLNLSSMSTLDRQPSSHTPEFRQPFVPQPETLQLSLSAHQYATRSTNELTAVAQVPLQGYTALVSHTDSIKKSRLSRKHKVPSYMQPYKPATKMPLQNSIQRDVDSLERNRLAAMKCRLTRKERENKLQKLSQAKMEQNVELRQEVERLEAEVLEAKKLLGSHLACA